MKHVFIINPAAGKKDSTTQVASSIRAACVRRGLDYDILTTEHPRHAVELVREKAIEYAGEPVRRGWTMYPSPTIPAAAATTSSSCSGPTAPPSRIWTI